MTGRILSLIEKKKGQDGNTYYYLRDYTQSPTSAFQNQESGFYCYVEDELKELIIQNRIIVDNLKLTSSGQLRRTPTKSASDEFYLMHGDTKVATVKKNGDCRIHRPGLMPYALYLEELEAEDIDTRIQNLDNFNHFLATRVLTMDRQYAKEIMNSLQFTQMETDRDRAQIALSYHALSLKDLYWIRRPYENVNFASINLYENSLGEAFVDVTLRGKQLSVQNSHLIADDLATDGVFPKAWIRRKDGFHLLKDGGLSAVSRELTASRIARCFDVRQVLYESAEYDGQKVSDSRIMTSMEFSIASMEEFSIYATNHDFDPIGFVKKLDKHGYYMMNIIDYLVGNTDRHWGNWGVLVDNRNNKPVRLYDLMDFNQSFQNYDTPDGAGCMTVHRTGERCTQREAAEEAVRQIGLNQIREIPMECIEDPQTREMFIRRLDILKSVDKTRD